MQADAPGAYHPESLVQAVKQRVPHNGFIVQPTQATVAARLGPYL